MGSLETCMLPANCVAARCHRNVALMSDIFFKRHQEFQVLCQIFSYTNVYFN